MILHLGVIDVPYVQPNPQPKARKASARPRLHKRHRKKYANVTTGDVAEILEAKYHVMEVFFRQHDQDVVAVQLEKSLKCAVESLMMGAPLTLDPFGTATSEIENRMKQFLSNREMDALGYPGVPTMAAQMGVSHRFAHPYKRRPARPSFIDTGLYQSSMKAWID
jgi:hypothetical protein